MTTYSSTTDAHAVNVSETSWDDSHAAQGLELRWIDAAGQNKVCPLGSQPIKIGSGPRCELRLSGKGLKPLHAVASPTKAGVVVRRWAIDTLLNGETFQESLLSLGDQLSIGELQLEVIGPATAPLDTTPEELSTTTEESSEANGTWSIEAPVPVESTTVESASNVPSISRERLTNSYLRAKSLLAALRVERQQRAETEIQIGLFTEQLELVHQQMQDSAAESNALYERIAQLEQELEFARAGVQVDLQPEEEVSNFAEPTTDSFAAMSDVEAEWNTDEATDYDNTADDAINEEAEEAVVEDVVTEDIVAEEAADELTALWGIEVQASESHESADATTYDDSFATEVEEAPVESSAPVESLEEEASYQDELASSVGSLLGELLEDSPAIDVTEDAVAEDSGITAAPEGFADAPDDFAGEEAPVSEADEPEAYEPTSFIEQFSHLVEEEPGELLGSDTDTGFGVEQPLVEPTSSLNLPTEAVPTASDLPSEDDSVDDYMEKMMARIRGETPMHAVPGSAKAPSVVEAPVVETIAPEEPVEEEHTSRIVDLSELRGASAAERGTDMESLRSLANSSARQAIEVAQSRQWRERVNSKITIVGIGFVGSIIGLVTSSTIFGMQFLLSVCFTGMFGYLGLRTLLKAQSDATLNMEVPQTRTSDAPDEGYDGE